MLQAEIKQGDGYSQHWSFAKPLRPGLPRVREGWLKKSELIQRNFGRVQERQSSTATAASPALRWDGAKLRAR